MTDPAGKVFISYKRTHEETAESLQQTLENHGIPTWRDVTHLETEPTVPAIKDVLEGPDIAAGLVIVSEDVVDSDIILNLELTKLYERWDSSDGFFVAVVLAEGVDYADAEAILADAPTAHDFSDWNMLKIESETDDYQRFENIVKVILSRRTREVLNDIPDHAPLDCGLYTYRSPPAVASLLVSFDWSDYFDGSTPSERIWNQRVHAAVKTSLRYIIEQAPNRTLRFQGQAHLPVCFATGAFLPPLAGVPARWLQADERGENVEEWSLHNEFEPCEIEAEYTEKNPSSSDLAVLVSVTDTVANEFGRTQAELPDFNAVLELSREDYGERLSAGQAAKAAETFEQSIRDALNKPYTTSRIHLFMAIPAGLAFLFGQKTNTLPPIQTYVLDEVGREYTPAILVD